MAKVAVLLPYFEMCELARPLVGNYAHITPVCVEYTKTEHIEARVLELESQGCELIIARGFQAKLVKHCVKLPVIEIRVTAQQLGALVVELRRELGLGCPKIGLIGFANMFCDTSRFNELFQIELQQYMSETGEDLPDCVNRAVEAGCQAVIGGDVACASALKLGLPHRFITSEQESIKDALDMAERVCYAIDLEKQNSAEMNTMLDFTFSGIMRIDSSGTIFRANRVTFNLLNQQPGNILGKNVLEVLPQLTQSALDKTLKDGDEVYAILLPIRKKEVVVNIAPITIDNEIQGALLTFQEGSRIIQMDTELRRELYQRGYLARYTFDQLPKSNKESIKSIAMVKRIANYKAPILLTGDAGSGKSLFAQCIHNESFTRGNAFISLDCSAYQQDSLDTMLFGNYTTRKDSQACMVEIAQGGTLYLSHIEMLSFELQYKLLDLIRGSFIHNGSNCPTLIDVRVIASSDLNLIPLVEQRQFRGDLYYALSTLQLSLQPLCRRKEEILDWVEFYMKQWQSRYKRYIHLTQGAKDFLESYDWPGNLDQVNSICERVVLLAEHRNVDEVFLRRQVEQMTPKILSGTEQVVVFKDEKAVQLAELLKKYNGNRQKVADELGISKTTLWRYIKKYGIGQDYSY